MKRLSLLTLVICALTLFTQSIRAQEVASISTLKEQIQKLEVIAGDRNTSEDVKALNRTFLEERRTQLGTLLQKRIDYLRQYRTAAGSVLAPTELKVVDHSIESLVIELQKLGDETESARPVTGSNALLVGNTSVSDSLPVNSPVLAGQTTSESAPQPTPTPADATKKSSVLEKLADKGFSLQRAVGGDDESEGASLSFLRTFGKKSVFSTDFALIWDRPLTAPTGSTYVVPEFSLEGHLTSDESESEDAWRLRGAVDVLTKFKTRSFTGMHNTFGAKFEASQNFDTKKLMFEYLFTPTAHEIGIGQYLARHRKTDPISFRWRPYFGLDAGHTFKRGDSTLPEETILRLVPRLRAEFRLNFIDRIFKSDQSRTLLYMDNTFYYLPLEDSSKTPNFLVAGLEISFNKNVGLGFKYKNGKSAPKFERVHTFGAEFTFRFGKSAE